MSAVEFPEGPFDDHRRRCTRAMEFEGRLSPVQRDTSRLKSVTALLNRMDPRLVHENVEEIVRRFEEIEAGIEALAEVVHR